MVAAMSNVRPAENRDCETGPVIEVPALVRNKAVAAGAEEWIERLPALVSSLEADWSITVGRPYEGGTEAFVAEATCRGRARGGSQSAPARGLE